MKELMMRALNLASVRGAAYADVRIVQNKTERIVVKDGVATGLNLDESIGFGVRVFAEGAWGFASSQSLSAAEIDRITNLAYQIAKASARVSLGRKIELGPAVVEQGAYTTPIEIDPFSVSIEEKLGVLMLADEQMARVEGLKVRRGNIVAIREHKLFANSEGAFTDQTIYEIGGGIPDGREFKAIQIGGPSGGCIPAKFIETQLDYKNITELGAIMGSGGLIVLDDETCMVELAHFFINFTQEEFFEVEEPKEREVPKVKFD